MKILSLFDGMACGMIAMRNAGVDVESYDAYEIDKYAVQTATHNFPMIQEHGDVFKADFTEYEDVDFLIGGSPCTYWSIAQTKNRETVASGIGWDLFSQYVRALREAKPKYFIYENNKSMSKQIRASIDETFGFEAVLINSALVSAQNRQRLYWVGKRNEDSTYSKVNVEQPEDRGILLRDILETGFCHKDKAPTIDANYYKGGNSTSPNKQSGQRNLVAETVCVASRGRNPDDPSDRTAGIPTEQRLEAHTDGKTNTLIKVSKDNLIAEPCCLRYERTDEAKECRKAYEAHEMHHGYNELKELQPRTDGKVNTLSTVLKDNPICIPATDICQVGALSMPSGESVYKCGIPRIFAGRKGKVSMRQRRRCGAKTGLYALAVDESVYECPKDCEIVITDDSIRCMRHDAKHSTVQGSHVNFEDGKSQTLPRPMLRECCATPCLASGTKTANPSKPYPVLTAKPTPFTRSKTGKSPSKANNIQLNLWTAITSSVN